MTKISIRKNLNTRIEEVDFENIPFGKFFSDHMFVCDYDGESWGDMEIRPFGTLTMHPAMLALHYGQSIFEGMKATIDQDGVPMLFRPERHARRLNISAQRMCMPEFPEDVFIEALEKLISLDRAWIPSTPGSALYIRPFMFATDETIGVRPSDKYRMIIFTQPVGVYYTKPVKLMVEKKYIRAASGGTGFAKAAGNYAGSLLPAQLAKKEGFDQVLWMDAKEFKYVQEVGTMNIFFVLKDKVMTPATGGTVLDGVTRDSVITLLREKGYHVEVGPVELEMIKEAYRKGELLEIFGAGTAAVIAKVSDLKDDDIHMKFDVDSYEVATFLYNTINDIRAGKQEDTRGWIHRIETEKILSQMDREPVEL